MKKLLLAIALIAILGSAAAAQTANVLLTWTASATPAAQLSQYNLYQASVSGGPYTKIGNTLDANSLSFSRSISLTASSQTAFFVVRAQSSDGTLESDNSNEVTVSLPAAPKQKPVAVKMNCSVSIPGSTVSGSCK